MGDWKRELVTTTVRTVYDSTVTGTAPVGPEYQPVAGTQVFWWWDRPGAAGWLALARTMAYADAATLAGVEATVSGTAASTVSIGAGGSGGVLPASGVRPAGLAAADTVGGPVGYLLRLFGAIANYYNKLNVPWYMHSTARLLYRKYMAGLPWNYGGGADQALFSDTRCYGHYDRFRVEDDLDGGWYRPNSALPRASRFGGIIAQRARELFLADYPHGRAAATQHPTNFVAWLTLDIARADGAPPADADNRTRAAYAPSVRNVVVPTSDPGIVGEHPLGGISGPSPRQTRGVTAVGTYGWDGYFYDVQPEVFGNEVNTTGPLSAAAPPRAYLAWAQEWVAALQRQTPADVLTDVLAYTAYVNAKQALVMGTNNFLAHAAGVDAAAIAEAARPDSGLQIAAATTAAVSAALTPIPVAGPVIAILGGAAAAGIKLFDALQSHPLTDIFQDDLGRNKPTLERNSLAGTPTATDASTMSDLYVADAPPTTGLTPFQMARAAMGSDLIPLGSGVSGDSARFAMARAAGLNGTGSETPTDLGMPAGTSESVVPTVAKVALGAGLVYAAYKLLGSSQAKRR